MHNMNRKIVFMFSGQGSQYFRMGEDLYRKHQLFRQYVNYFDALVERRLGISPVKELYGAVPQSTGSFDNILITHPILFIIQYSLAKCLIDEGIVPSYLLGMSLGESVALSVGGVVEPEVMLESLISQAVVYDKKCAKGGMIAVLKSTTYFEENRAIFSGCELSAINFPSLFCISGPPESLASAQSKLKNDNVIFERLPIKQPFHSSLIDPIKEDFYKACGSISFHKERIPVLSSLGVNPIREFDENYLWNVVRKPILFQQTISDFSEFNNASYVDLSPSGTSANFVKYSINKNRYGKIYSIINAFGNDFINYQNFKNEFTNDIISQGALAC